MTMTKAEILDIWKGFVRNMSDQGAVVHFAHEIESRVRNELLDRLEAAEKERDTLRAAVCHEADCVEACKEKVETLDAELKAAHAMALNGVEWKELAQKYESEIEAMKQQESVAWRTFDGEGGYDYRNYEDNENYLLGWNARNPNHAGWVEPLYLAPGAQTAQSIHEGWKLVPIEPTQEMLDAGEGTFVPTYTGTPVSAPIDVYRAMLEAAPEAKPCP